MARCAGVRLRALRPRLQPRRRQGRLQQGCGGTCTAAHARVLRQGAGGPAMKPAAEAGFQLDARLAADTLFVAEWSLCRVLLMDDAQFPWLVLVPRREGLAELDDLADRERMQLMRETVRAMKM